MSDQAELPPTTAWSVLFVALIGTIALVATDPSLVPGVLVGGVLAIAILGFGDSLWRVLVASAVLSVGAFGAIGAVGFAAGSSAFGGLPAIASLFVGVGLVVTITGGIPNQELRQVGVVGACTGVFSVFLFSFTSSLSAEEATLMEFLSALSFIFGDGATGFAITIVMTGIVLAGAVMFLPVGMFYRSPHENRQTAFENKRKMAGTIVVYTVLVLVVMVVLRSVVVIFGYGNTPLSLVTEGLLVRSVLFSLSGIGVFLAVVSIGIRLLWGDVEETALPAYPLVFGAVVGTLLSLLLLVVSGLRAQQPEAAAALYGGTAIVFGIGGPLAVRYAKWGNDVAADGATLLAFSLVATVLGWVGVNEPVGLGLRGVALLVALAAGLFAYSASRYGTTLAAEVGSENAAPEPQLLSLGRNGAIAAIGLVAAVPLLWVSTFLTPTLALNSAAGLFAGLVAILASLWLLFR